MSYFIRKAKILNKIHEEWHFDLDMSFIFRIFAAAIGVQI